MVVDHGRPDPGPGDLHRLVRGGGAGRRRPQGLLRVAGAGGVRGGAVRVHDPGPHVGTAGCVGGDRGVDRHHVRGALSGPWGVVADHVSVRRHLVEPVGDHRPRRAGRVDGPVERHLQ
ncbi:hypothetical protein SDC9_126318 [bioreactor metagenome]|uniref:Uncharacterized protein n=1 Tax=bioreactor metagenome TaxID=1076179 RepID=A0A645CQV7_9ZZZZ